MRFIVVALGVAASAALSACGTGGRIDEPNTRAANDQINAIAANISETDGTDPNAMATTDAQTVGDNLRQSATVRPPKATDVAAGH